MGCVSLYEDEQERRDEALYQRGVERTENQRPRLPRSFFETAQSVGEPIARRPPSYSERRSKELLQRGIDRQRRQLAWRNAQKHNFSLDFEITLTEPELQDRDLCSERSVIARVQRVVHRALVGGSREIWLKIRGPKGDLISQRPPNDNDKHVLSAKDPSFFSLWIEDPPEVPCLARWTSRNDLSLIGCLPSP